MAVTLGTCALASAARGAAYNEVSRGDISGNRSAPSLLTLTPGTNSILAQTGSGDLEYLRLSVPAGGRITQMNLISYGGNDGVAFIAIQQGTTFTEDPNSPNPSNLLGYSHFGTGSGNVGTNLLTSMNTPPLTASDYTLWIQQLGSVATYHIDVIATPEPGGAFLLAASTGFACLRRHRSARM